MARLHDLKYHEDEVTKHEITKEELCFLKNLQKEMNTQDTVCQADPRYWVIKGTEKVYGIDWEFADGYTFYNDGDEVANSMEKLADYIRENFFSSSDHEDDKVSYSEWGRSIEISTADDETTLDSPDEAVEWLNSHMHCDLSVSYYRNESRIYPGPVFITHKDAQEHLKNNYYHYSDNAHTYALTAHRSPSIEKLYKILHEVDFEALEAAIQD